MSTLDDLMRAVEVFCLEQFCTMAPTDRAAIASACARGCLLQLRVTPRAASTVEMFVLAPNGEQETLVGSIVELEVGGVRH
ncbi:MAG TPA: hypothetical protein VJT81_00395 [Burkholderiales bacterium]|nr:hypothetical protein [Burkholderiales bacterium]